ncbi:sugar transferase [Patescibacteria group bacterium]|nr:sugar transferase [Patescibacteria group bacterium]
MSTTVYQKFGKRGIDVFLSSLGIIFLSPVFLIVALLIKLDSPGPVIFKQKRVGKDGKTFTFYKFRNMVKNAEKLKKKYLYLNEANGPVFKIKNDPRYTRIGKFLSHTGLDELPQLINILKGEMSLVGPRPLPINEEKQIPKKWQAKRRQAKPGIACSWLLKGAHSLSFTQWMKLDLGDIKKSSLSSDLTVFFKTVFLGLRLVKDESLRKNHFPFSE